jgi:hypothetical protein
VGINAPNIAGNIPRRGSSPYERLCWLVLGLVVLAIIMCLVWAYAFAHIVVHRTASPWAPIAQVAWVTTWILVALAGLCVGCAPGLVLVIRPALFMQLAGPAVMRRRGDVRRWPRLVGLTLAWAGIGNVAFAVTILTYGEVTIVTHAEVAPVLNVSKIAALVVIFAVTYVPFWVTKLMAALLPHPIH